MDHEEFYEIFNHIEEQMLDLSNTIASLKKELGHVIEENNQLRMTNHDLHDMVINQSKQAGQDTESASSTLYHVQNGNIPLQSYYDEGIHVCHQLFGARRSLDEECILCLGVLDEFKK